MTDEVKRSRRRFLKGRSARLMAGGSLCLLGWLQALRVNGSEVFHYLERFVLWDDGRYLLAAAVTLVILNTMRAVLLYLGWFYLGESMTGTTLGKRTSWAAPLVAIPFSYLLVSQYPDVLSLHFGTAALFSVATVLVMHLSTREIRGWVSRSLVLAMLVFSFQWLDVSPSLTRWGFGGGELSMAVKTLAQIEEWDWVMDALSLGMFLTAFIGGIAAAALLVSANIHNVQFRKIRARDMEISALREETLRVRGYREIQQLVHDLRRPLTTVLGLADVLAETLSSGMELDYAKRIVKTGTNMNQMIEELLKEDARQRIIVGSLVEYVQSQISAFEWRRFVTVETDECVSRQIVRVNLIRFSRALVNILDNAHLAVKDRSAPRIRFAVSLEDDAVVFAVEDNGRGFLEFPEKYLANNGLSGWGSTGIGLAFADEVVKNHGGRMSLSNMPFGGACVTIRLPVKEDM